jgi:RNA polymerase sigma-70 factor (ECF subfamily)
MGADPAQPLVARGQPRRPGSALQGPLAMVRVGRGDREAFRTVYESYRDDVYAILVRMVLDAGVAEDLMQETFLRVYREAGRYDPSRPLEPWIYRIARNLAVDHLRNRKRRAAASLSGPDAFTIDAPDPARGPVEEAAAREREELLREGLGKLRPGQREIFVLVDLEGLKYEDVADMLGISVKAVGARLRKARRRFLNWAMPNEKRLLGDAEGAE